MSGLAGLPRWSVEVLRFAAMVAIALTVATVYTARGDNHDTTYWACLYAGSLSQVGTTEPANCGRGTKISWNAQGAQGGSGISGLVTMTGGVSGSGLNAGDWDTHHVTCQDGRVPIGSGYSLGANPLEGVMLISNFAVSGDPNNPYGFRHSDELPADAHGWFFAYVVTMDGTSFNATFEVLCAYVDPSPAT